MLTLKYKAKKQKSNSNKNNSNTVAVFRDHTPRVSYFMSRKNLRARKGALTVRLHKDGYFRRERDLPTQVCTPIGPGHVTVDAKNEMRRGLFLQPVHS